MWVEYSWHQTPRRDRITDWVNQILSHLSFAASNCSEKRFCYVTSFKNELHQWYIQLLRREAWYGVWQPSLRDRVSHSWAEQPNRSIKFSYHRHPQSKSARRSDTAIAISSAHSSLSLSMSLLLHFISRYEFLNYIDTSHIGSLGCRSIYHCNQPFSLSRFLDFAVLAHPLKQIWY